MLRFGRGLAEILTRQGVVVDSAMWNRIQVTLGTTLLPADYVEEGNLTRADVYRIRAGKFLATQLPPSLWLNLSNRRLILKEVKEMVGQVLGEEVGPSRFLGG